MDYFSKFLRSSNPPPPPVQTDRFAEFLPAWETIKNTLTYPDERQLARGIQSTDVPNNLKVFVDVLVWESTKTEEGGTGACLEYLLKNDVLGTLVRLSEMDRPSGIQAEVLRAVQNLVVLMDEHFLVHSAVHKAVLRLLRNCAGDDLQDQLDGRKVMGAAGSVVHRPISEYEEDLVNLLCILCSRIRTFRELLMIFFHDKHWHQSEPLFSVEEEDEEEDDEESNSGDSVSTINATTGNAEGPSNTGPTLDKRAEYEFLLFNYLLRFVHREGPTGDFARAGCLFLIDVAMSTGEPPQEPSDDTETTTGDPIRDAELALAEYILNGDFPQVLAAGLGAVYSLLPSKLGFRPDPQPFGTNIEDPDGRKKDEGVVETEVQPQGAEDGLSESCRSRIDHFLKMLEFLADVLRRSSPPDQQEQLETLGIAIGRTILDAVRQSFLENVLYPSILECTDADGSAIAVMSYIEITIRTLKKGPLSDLILQYLLSEDNADIPSKQRQAPVVDLVEGPPSASSNRSAKHRRRKSSAMVLLEMEAPDTQKPTEYLTSLGRYTLRDLLLANLQSSSAITATTALQLLRTIITKHPQLASERLIIGFRDTTTRSWSDHKDTMTSDDPDQEQPESTYSTHEREMGLYFTLITRVDPSHSGDAFSTGYNRYLCDALSSTQSQLATRQDFIGTAKHRLSLSDPVLTLLLDSLRRFFANTAEFNIALTGVLSTLASDPERSLAGWLTFASTDDDRDLEPLTEKDPIELILDDNHSIDGEINDLLAKDLITLPAASMSEKSRPLIQTIFQGLVNQLEHYRASIDKFDTYLQQRRQGLLFSENMTDALHLSLDIMEGFSPSKPVTEAAPPPPKPKTSSSFVSYFTPKKSKAAPPSTAPETQSPKRGAKTQEVASPFGRHYQETRAVTVDPFMVSEPSTVSNIPAADSAWNTEGDDVFGSNWHSREETTESAPPPQPTETRTITLSELLDNVVILEESIKEFAAIIYARRSLGIDSVRYI